MELLDRYLQAVRFWLPREQREDILAELTEDIRSQIEEEEAELGRKLDEAGLEALLKRWGNPTLVAERYLPQRYLIGPALFPIYLLVLKIYLWTWAAPWMVVWICLVILSPGYRAAHPGIAVIGTLYSLWIITTYSVLFTTIGFALLERFAKPGLVERWDPHKLPAVPDANRIPRSHSIAQLVWDVVVALWWLGWLRLPAIPDVRFTPSPKIGQIFYWPVLWLLVSMAGMAGVNAFRPRWTMRRAGTRLAIDILGLILTALLLTVGPWVAVAAPNAPAAGESIAKWTNFAWSIVLVLTALIFFLRGVQDARRMLHKGPIRNWAVRLLFGE